MRERGKLGPLLIKVRAQVTSKRRDIRSLTSLTKIQSINMKLFNTSKDPEMQLNLSKSTKQPNNWFAGALFVFSLLGYIHPHHMSYTKGHYHANILYSHQIQNSDDDFWYTPPRNPAFNDLLGS
jgi:hypothetical protein